MIKYLYVKPWHWGILGGQAPLDVILPDPQPPALLNTDPHGRVLLRIIQRIILYYSSLSSRSKSSILTEMADVVSVLYLNVARLRLLFENTFIGPRSDHSLPMSVTDWLTHSLTSLLKLEWIDLHADYAEYAQYAEHE